MSVYFRYFPNENASENFKGMDATKSMDREEGEEEKAYIAPRGQSRVT